MLVVYPILFLFHFCSVTFFFSKIYYVYSIVVIPWITSCFFAHDCSFA